MSLNGHVTSSVAGRLLSIKKNLSHCASTPSLRLRYFRGYTAVMMDIQHTIWRWVDAHGQQSQRSKVINDDDANDCTPPYICLSLACLLLLSSVILDHRPFFSLVTALSCYTVHKVPIPRANCVLHKRRRQSAFSSIPTVCFWL